FVTSSPRTSMVAIWPFALSARTTRTAASTVGPARYGAERRRTTGFGTAGSSRTMVRSRVERPRSATGGADRRGNRFVQCSVGTRMKTTRPFLLASAVLVGLLGVATAGFVAHAGAAKTSVTVTEKEFSIKLSVRRVP